jgi:linoleoyl-CoA desaturase
MQTPIVNFNKEDRPEFVEELRKRVNKHFKENNISKYANLKMKVKTTFMIGLYFIPLIVLLSGIVTNVWVMMLTWVLMSFGMSGIGLSVMHDANHGAYSKNKKVNAALGFLANFLGAYHINWKIQHNVLHHSFTNIHEFDDDISKPIMRFTPDQPYKTRYRFQAFYASFFYGLMTIYWMLSKDFEQIFRYEKKNLLHGQGLTKRQAIFQVAFNKIWYTTLTLVLPLILLPFAWWQIVLGFVLMHFLCGLTLAYIFQPAHVLEETNFYKVDETGSVENSWAIHQLHTTSNFANNSTAFSWYVGGLNFQIEHHLFPNICHIHYKSISSIVKDTAREYGVPYHEHRTFFDALKSHFSLLNSLGTGAYDLKKKPAIA